MHADPGIFHKCDATQSWGSLSHVDLQCQIIQGAAYLKNNILEIILSKIICK